ncbi:RNA polymerase subunit sigma-70, partial [Streptomyces sp. JAC18]
IVDEFLAAATSGRTEPLVHLLSDNAVAIGDGGGKIPARARAVEGALGRAGLEQTPHELRDGEGALAGGSPAVFATTANNAPALV